MKKVFFVLLGIVVLGVIVVGGRYIYLSGDLGVDDLSGWVDGEYLSDEDQVDNMDVEDNEDEVVIADTIQYYNEKYGYSLEFPEDWFVDFYGEDKENADMVWFVSDEEGLRNGNGGMQIGAKIEIIIQDLDMFKEVDSTFPNIESIDDWIDWEDENQPSVEDDLQGEVEVSEIIVGGFDAVKEVFENPTEESYGKSMDVKFIDPSGRYVFMIQYLGDDKAYNEFKDVFDQVVESFSF